MIATQAVIQSKSPSPKLSWLMWCTNLRHPWQWPWWTAWPVTIVLGIPLHPLPVNIGVLLLNCSKQPFQPFRICISFSAQPLATPHLHMVNLHHWALPFKVCQGNGAGPALWLATSTPLIKMLWHHGFVSEFSCPISRQSISLMWMIYVDDCNLLAFILSLDATGIVLQALQQNVLLWQGGLMATGGALSLKKCSWGLLAFHHKGHCWLPNLESSALAAICIMNQEGQPTPIQCFCPQDGVEVVGVTQSLSSDLAPALLAFPKG